MQQFVYEDGDKWMADKRAKQGWSAFGATSFSQLTILSSQRMANQLEI